MRTPKAHVGFRPWDHTSHHVVYEHDHTPLYLHLACPSCGKRATARGARFGTYELRCPKCLLRRTSVTYEDLPPLFYQVAVGVSTLWAWNRDHLVETRASLSAPHANKRAAPISRHYLHREWLLKRKAFCRAIDRVLRTGA